MIPERHPTSKASRDAPRPLPGCLSHFAVPVVAATILFAVGVGIAIGTLADFGPSTKPAPSVRVERTGPHVVTAIRQLSRLEGAEYHIERVIELTEKQQRVFGLVEAEDVILLIASGRVVAGVDLSKIEDGDIRVDPNDGSVALVLPRPEIFHARLDNDRTYVHSRKTDLLAKRKESLEGAARRRAEATLSEAALESGLLRDAEAGVRRTVTSLVRALGFDGVEIVFADRVGRGEGG